MSDSLVFRTPLTELLGSKNPVMLAGMFKVSTHKVCAAVSNAGGIGNIGGLSYNPKMLRQEIHFVRELLHDKTLPFGVDLLIPKLGEGARKTNYDYTKGNFAELVDVIIEEKVKLFTCAVGVPPKWAVDKLHAAGVVCMNMVGEPQHVPKALAAGMDIICAQGTEAGGHTSDIATMPLVPQCVDLVKGKKNYFGGDVLVVAAGGIFDGRGLAASLALGAQGVWVGTRFIAAEESNATQLHKEQVVGAQSTDTMRTLIFTGRPARMLRTDYVNKWEAKPDQIRKLLDQGKIPYENDPDAMKIPGVSAAASIAMGQAVGGITEIKSSRAIIEDMLSGARASISRMSKL